MPFAKITNNQRLVNKALGPRGKSHHAARPAVGNSRLVLQVRYRAAALIFDGSMQISYEPRHDWRQEGIGSL
jgi:hypothetical protein